MPVQVSNTLEDPVMKRFFLLCIGLLVSFALMLPISVAQVGEKDDPKAQKPSLGDKDDAAIQNKRFLKVRNETSDTLSIFIQYRTIDNGAWSWIPADPTKAADAISVELEAGKELDVQYKDEPLAASRMRIWATSPTQKWLKYKTKDIWLVPERNEEGEHTYLAPAIETFSFVFSSSKDKGVIAGDSDVTGEQNLPTEGENLPQPIPDIPWDVIPSPLPPDFPLIRDLAVLPIYTTGPNATVRVKNLGHFSSNMGRRLVVQKIAPGSLPEDKGPIGPLFHYSVKTFYLIGMAPGNYLAFITPGDEIPYEMNDKKPFTITAAAYGDVAVLPVVQGGGKVWLKVKNVGTAPVAPGRHLYVKKLPIGPTLDQGAVGGLGVNDIKPFPGLVLAAGNYRAYLSPADPAPHHANDDKFFSVAVSTFVDHDIISVTHAAGKATVKVKNIGTANAPPGPGPHLKIKKLPLGPTVDAGAVGSLNINEIKTFFNIPLAPGNYKATITPNDAPPHHANDSENFSMTGTPDLEANLPAKVVGAVKANIHCHGVGDYGGGTRTWHLEKMVGGSWVAIPTFGSHIIPPIANGMGHTVQGTFTGNGLYRLRISAGDSNAGNDTASKVLP
jgi:hypothetical protein